MARASWEDVESLKVDTPARKLALLAGFAAKCAGTERVLPLVGDIADLLGISAGELVESILDMSSVLAASVDE